MASSSLLLLGHPVITHRMAELRDRSTGRDRFRQLSEEVSAFLAYEALRDIRTTETEVETPVASARVTVVDESVLLVPILRAGLVMIPGVQSVVPDTVVAHLGMVRNDETLEATTYLDRLPDDLKGRRVVVCDPMLATGGSMVEAIKRVESKGSGRIQALCIVASREGIKRVGEECQGIQIVCAAVDDTLNDQGYIVPGLGDAGDRLWGPPGQP